MTSAGESPARVLRRLAPSVYVPTLLEFIGQSALLPVVPLLALQLGFAVPQAAALALVFGVFSVLGPIPAGRLIERVGARPALVVSGAVLVAADVAAFVVITPGLTGAPEASHRAALLAVLVVIAACTQVWKLGRQAYLGSALPPAMRARGMTLFGGMIRIGQVIGPLAGAAVLATGHDTATFLLYAGTGALATVMVAVFLPPGERARQGAVARVARSVRTPLRRRLDRAVLARMVRVGLGIAPVMMSRVNRPVVVPLLGAALGLDAAAVSLVFGISALVEIAMVVPAGTLMDRRGRAAVAVPCALVMGAGYVLLAVAAATLGERGPGTAMAALLLPSLLIALGNGLGAGIVMTLGIDLSPVHGRTGYLAWWNTLLGTGSVLAPLLVSAITLVAPVAVAGAATGALCLAGGAWLARVLPGVTPAGGTRGAARGTAPR